MPAIKTVEIRDNAELDGALERLAAYSWIVFTSQAGVGVFFDRLLKSGRDARALSGIRLAAIGGATEKALAERGLIADCVRNNTTLPSGKGAGGRGKTWRKDLDSPCQDRLA